VIVCRRNRDSAVSELVPLVSLPAYPAAMAAGTLGEAVTQLRRDADDDAAARRRALDALLAVL
jgi:hypothetical protein